MRRRLTEILALAVLVSSVSASWGQQASPAQPNAAQPPVRPESQPPKAPPKSNLEEMLEQALKDNPDLRVAAVKVAEAEAELNRTRLQVMQKVVTLYRAVEAQRAAVTHKEDQLKRLM